MSNLREIEDLIGFDATRHLVREFGGKVLGIPKRPGGTRLAESVGEEAARLLSKRFGGDRLYISNAPSRHSRNREIRRLRDEGCRIEVLSARFRPHRASNLADPQQPVATSLYNVTILRTVVFRPLHSLFILLVWQP